MLQPDLMSPALSHLRQLPLSERIQLVEDLWDSIAEESPDIGLHPAHLEELDRRLDAVESQPTAGTPWALARERLLAGL